MVAFSTNLWRSWRPRKWGTKKNYQPIHAPFFLYKTQKDQAGAKRKTDGDVH